MRTIISEYFRKYARHSEQAVEALFPLSRPVAGAVVEGCKPWTDDTFAISLTQVRIVTIPKPAFRGMLPVPWKTSQTKELADALARARVLEGREKNAVYEEFGLLALRQKVNDWLKGKGFGQLALDFGSPIIL